MASVRLTPRLERKPAIALAAMVVVLAVHCWLRIAHLGGYSLWYDEVFSATTARLGWTGLFREVLADKIHPPLYYVVLKLWIGVVGAEALRLRLLSVIFSLAAVPPLWKTMKLLGFSDGVCLAITLAVATNPYLIFYSQEVRMYSLLWLLATLSLFCYLQLLTAETPRNQALLAVVNVLLAATHLAGLAIVGAETIHWYMQRRRTSFVPAALPAVVVVMTWGVAAVLFNRSLPAAAHGQNLAWIPRPTLLDGLQSVGHALGGKAAALLFQIPIVIALWRARQRRGLFLFLLLASVASVVGIFVVSWTLRPVWQDRYLIAAVVPYYLLLGLSIETFSGKAARRWALAVAVLALVGMEYDVTHAPGRPVFNSFEKFQARAGKAGRMPLLASDDMVGAPLDYANGRQGGEAVGVLTGVTRAANGEVRCDVRNVHYHFGNLAGPVRPAENISPRDFLYAYDAQSAALLGASQNPADFVEIGCSLRKLATTRGEGHVFTLFSVHC